MNDINKVMQLFMQNKLLENGYDLSQVRVIEPINFDMNDCKVFYDDFIFVFYSTLEKHRDAFILGCKTFIESYKDSTHAVDLESYRKELNKLARKEQSEGDNLLFLEVIDSYLELLVLNSVLGSQSIHGEGFTRENEFGTLYWYYFGTKKLAIEDVNDKFNKKRDWLLKNKSTRKSMVYCIFRK